MALVNVSQPSLIGGVSQQPEVLRPRSSAEAQDNAYSSVVDGLIKRHPTKHIAQLGWTTDFVHTINRDEIEKYFLLIDDAGVPRVIDITGKEFTLVDEFFSDRAAYLTVGSLPAKERYRSVTIADTTVIVNREVTVDPEVPTGDSPLLSKWRAFVFFKTGAFSTWYRINIRTRLGMVSTFKYNLKTWAGLDGQNVWIDKGSNTFENSDAGIGLKGFGGTSTDLLAKAFVVGINDRFNAVTHPITATAKDGVLMLVADPTEGGDFDPDNATVEFSVDDGIGGTALVKVWDTVERLSDLPRTFLHDYRVTVQGDESDDQDDFTVRFIGEDSSDTDNLQNGKWEEFYAYGATTRVGKPLTLPLKMTRKFDSDGSITGTAGEAYFEFDNSFAVFDEKQAGDDSTNPSPSWIDQKINDVFFHENRLGFLTGQNVVMSGANGFFDFWQETMQAGLLDSDPIDVAAGHTSVAILRNAIPIGSALLLFSDKVQFQVLSGEDGILSPKTISLEPVAVNETQPLVRPVPLSGALIFPFKSGQFSGITEMASASGVKGAWTYTSLTQQVPQYISGEVTNIAVNSRAGVVAVLADGDTSVIYIFKEFQGPDGRLQAAWMRYTFTGSPVIRAVNFIGELLYLLVERGAVTTLETLAFNSSPRDLNTTFLTHLDRRLDESQVTSRVYTAATDTTAITLPYSLAAGEVAEVFTRADGTVKAGQRLVVTNQTSTVVAVEGDHTTTPFWVGVQYEMFYQFAKPQLRAQEGQGTSAIQSGRVQVMRGLIVHDNTGFFTVGVKLPTREEVVKSFGPIIQGEGLTIGNLVNAQTFEDGRFKFPVMGNADDAVIVVRNNSPLPSNFQKAEWEIKFDSRSTRFRA